MTDAAIGDEVEAGTSMFQHTLVTTLQDHLDESHVTVRGDLLLALVADPPCQFDDLLRVKRMSNERC
jgi:hypothetical protein